MKNLHLIAPLFFVAAALADTAAAACPQIETQLRPREGEEINRLHTRFRWAPVQADLITPWFLEVVEDDGSPDPFLTQTPVVQVSTSNAEPRTVVTSGLEWDTDYAWRTLAISEPLPGRRFVSATHRFRTQELPPVPAITVTQPPGANPPQPGLTLFNYRTGGNFPISRDGLALAVDLTGKLVYCYRYPDRRVGDLSQLENGRLLWIMSAPAFDAVPGRMVETTLDGRQIDISPAIPFETSVHHEVQRLPNGNPFLLIHEDRYFPGMTADFWQGDMVIEYDRHTWIELKRWSVFDHYNMNDYEPQLGPGNDWTHGNAATFDPATGLVYLSARKQSRITCFEWATGNVVYHMGKNFASGDATFGDNYFSFQHAPEPQPNGNLLLFDNGNILEPLSNPRQSRAIEIAFNHPTTPTDATIVWEYKMIDDLGDPVYGPFLGDSDRLPNGNTLLCGGPNNQLHEVDSNSQLVWKLFAGPPFPVGSVYRCDRIPTLIVDTPGDTDDDWDLDLRDLAVLQNQLGKAAPLPFPATLADRDGSGDLDEIDLLETVTELTGPSKVLGAFPLE